MRKRLGEILLEEGLISEAQLSLALGEQRQWGGRLGTTLVKKGFITEADMAFVLARQLGIKWVSLKNRRIRPEVLACLKGETARKYTVMPLACDGTELTLAVSDPTDLATLDTLKFITGKRVRAVMAVESDIVLSIARHYEGEHIRAEDYRESVVTPRKGTVPHAVRPFLGAGAVSSRGGTAVVEQTLSSLIRLLIEKNLITKEELLGMMREGK
jgi:hypothetical protein